jgi:hypothetical protein
MGGDKLLSFLSTVTAVEITPSELSLETFFPADQATADALKTL